MYIHSGLNLMAIWSRPLKCLDSRYALPHPVRKHNYLKDQVQYSSKRFFYLLKHFIFAIVFKRLLYSMALLL